MEIIEETKETRDESPEIKTPVNKVKSTNRTKRAIITAVAVLCIGTAAYLNWSYNHQSEDNAPMLDPAISESKSNEEEVINQEENAYMSDYFAVARLTRQKSRDEALSLLESAAKAQNASQETIDGAMNTITAMATYSMQETQIENMLLAKEFEECVAFMSADGMTIAIPAPTSGLDPQQVARITDAIIAETGLDATQIKIIEVKEPTEEEASDDTIMLEDKAVEDENDSEIPEE